MSLLVLWYNTVLHVSGPKAIIRWNNLTNIFTLLNCALYTVSYNLNAYYYMYLVYYSVNIFSHVSEISLNHCIKIGVKVLLINIQI
jgi:hypothetical protein